MCASTMDAEEKNDSANTALHVSHSVSSSSPTNECLRKNSNDRDSSRPIFENPLKNKEDDDDGKNNPIVVSLSLTQAGAKHAQGKHSLVLPDDGENLLNNLNSSLLENGDQATPDDGSISELNATNDSDTNVEVKSSNFCAGMSILPVGVCEGSTEFAEQMDIFMRCQHPLDILAMFHEDEVKRGVSSDSINHSFTGETDGDAQVHRVSGYHAIPRSCEYCGSQNIDVCRDSTKCERPKTYFPKERPPFCSEGGFKCKEENNVGIASNGRDDNVISESDESTKMNEATIACSAWV